VEYGLLKQQGYIVWERSAQIQRKEICGLNMVKEKNYKTTVITFLALEESGIWMQTILYDCKLQKKYDKSNLCREF